MNYEKRIADELNIQSNQVKSTILLLDEGNTIPFIARYRKEMTFNLDELQLRKIEEKLQLFRTVDDRRNKIVDSIEKQDLMTDAIYKKLQIAETLVELEDLYQPYKPKRVTRASKAIDAGLEPLARKILKQSKQDVEQEARKHITDDFPTTDDVLSGARDIVAQIIADDSDVRSEVRRKGAEWGIVRSTKVKSADDERGLFKIYYDFESRIKWIKPYQILALNRGSDTKILRVKIEISERDWLPIVHRKYRPRGNSGWAGQLELAIADSAKRLLLPAIERDIHRSLTETAHVHAIDVFAENVRRLLLQPPLSGYIVLGIDPGFRSGCKVAIVDATGNVLDTATIYPNPPQSRYDETLKTLNEIIQRYKVSLIVIGNGTASRETELLVAELVTQNDQLRYIIVNEAGASVYSASEIARQEFPEMDVTIRGAVSIARRIQDPLAELVKIDPKSIGVGLYQHDVDQTQLAESLSWVVQLVVNQVGVDLNTCSASLLKYVSGITEKVANQMIAFRNEHGRIQNLKDLLKVKGVGAKTFEQAAGFLRIRNGDNWLDSSAIHPESYSTTSNILKFAEIDPNSTTEEHQIKIDTLLKTTPISEIAFKLDVGIPTIEDILEQLKRPGRDPREDIPLPILRSDILKMEDLEEGFALQGTVRNVVDFGAFVDIGVKQDGLLHSSKIPKHISLHVGDVIDIRILSIDKDRGRIGLALG
jgi:protein Tex